MSLPVAVAGLVFLLALVQIMLRPSMADRLMGGQMAGASGVAILLLLQGDAPIKAGLDIILVMALLAGVTIIVFALEPRNVPACEEDHHA